MLKGSEVKVFNIIGFPLWATLSVVKKFEAKEAIKAGADEIDMILNIYISKEYNYIENEVKLVKEGC